MEKSKRLIYGHLTSLLRPGKFHCVPCHEIKNLETFRNCEQILNCFLQPKIASNQSRSWVSFHMFPVVVFRVRF